MDEHTLSYVQKSVKAQDRGEAQVDGCLQVNGPPGVSSLQVVYPVTVRQSEEMEQVTKIEKKQLGALGIKLQLPY